MERNQPKETLTHKALKWGAILLVAGLAFRGAESLACHGLNLMSGKV